MSVAHPFPSRHEAEHKHHLGGDCYYFEFPNGYAASVVRFDGSYGYESGKWELGVMIDGHGLTYDTPITDDVLGHLSEQDVANTLDLINALPTVAA